MLRTFYLQEPTVGMYRWEHIRRPACLHVHEFACHNQTPSDERKRGFPLLIIIKAIKLAKDIIKITNWHYCGIQEHAWEYHAFSSQLFCEHKTFLLKRFVFLATLDLLQLDISFVLWKYENKKGTICEKVVFLSNLFRNKRLRRSKPIQIASVGALCPHVIAW